ncbi:MAG: DinB family protein [Pyrinomonadaceae bacterium]
MIQNTRWFEREFSFDLPGWMYPNVVERLRGTPARLEDRLASLPQNILTRRDGEQWSMQEHAGHLLDLGALDLARLDDYEAGRTALQVADLQNRKTFEANHNSNSIANVLALLRAERAEFVRRLDEYDEEIIFRSAVHPRLKTEMRLLDFAFFVAEHDDHHLARITGLIRKFA